MQKSGCGFSILMALGLALSFGLQTASAEPAFEGVSKEKTAELGLNTLSLTSATQAENLATKIVAQMDVKAAQGFVFTQIVLNHIGTGKPQEMYVLLVALHRKMRDHPALSRVKVVYNWIPSSDLDSAVEEVITSIDDPTQFERILLTYRDDPSFQGPIEPLKLRERIKESLAQLRLSFGISGGLSWVGLFGYPRPIRDWATDLVFATAQALSSSWILFHKLSEQARMGTDVSVVAPIAVNLAFSYYYVYNSAGNTHFKSQANYVSTKIGSDPNRSLDERASEMYRRDLKILMLKGLVDSIIMRMAILVSQNWTDQGLSLESGAVLHTLTTSLLGVPAKMPIDVINARVQANNPRAAVWVRAAFGILYSGIQISDQLGSPTARNFLISAGLAGITMELINRRKTIAHNVRRTVRRIRGIPANPLHCVTLFMPQVEINDRETSDLPE